MVDIYKFLLQTKTQGKQVEVMKVETRTLSFLYLFLQQAQNQEEAKHQIMPIQTSNFFDSFIFFINFFQVFFHLSIFPHHIRR